MESVNSSRVIFAKNRSFFGDNTKERVKMIYSVIIIVFCFVCLLHVYFAMDFKVKS